MSTNPIPGWDLRCLAATESAFGTPPTPATQADYAALDLQVHEFDTGPAEQGKLYPYAERGLGRDTNGRNFAEGKIEPIPWSITMPLLGRTAVDGSARELVLYKAAGLEETISGSTSAAYAPTRDPIGGTDFASATLERFLGHDTELQLAETLRGCVVNSLQWSGGDKPLMLKATGKAIGKYTRGALDSVSMSDVATTLTTTAAQGRALGIGYYLCEAEVIKVTAVGSTTTDISRAQLASTAVAHSTKPFRPWCPNITAADLQIPPTTTTITIDSIALRALAWSVDFSTGLDLLPPESGSAYSQGAKSTRFDVSAKINLLLKGDDVVWLNRATRRAAVGGMAMSIVQGATAGDIFTLTAGQVEVAPFATPAPSNDLCAVELSIVFLSDGTGGAPFTVTLT